MTREKFTGIKVLDSKRGSSNQNPFVALVDAKTDEFQGEAYGFNLVYSGNHETVIQKIHLTKHGHYGINSFNFGWQLKTGDSFQTPEVVMVLVMKV